MDTVPILLLMHAGHADQLAADALKVRPADVAALMKASPTGRVWVDRLLPQPISPLLLSTTERSPIAR